MYDSIKRGGGKERLYGDMDGDFCSKKWGASYEKKLAVCLELQRGQEK